MPKTFQQKEWNSIYITTGNLAFEPLVLSDKESDIVYTTSLGEAYWGTIIEDDYPGIDLKNKERTEIEKDIIIRFTKEDLSYAVDRKTGKPLFQ